MVFCSCAPNQHLKWQQMSFTSTSLSILKFIAEKKFSQEGLFFTCLEMVVCSPNRISWFGKAQQKAVGCFFLQPVCFLIAALRTLSSLHEWCGLSPHETASFLHHTWFASLPVSVGLHFCLCSNPCPTSFDSCKSEVPWETLVLSTILPKS